MRKSLLFFVLTATLFCCTSAAQAEEAEANLCVVECKADCTVEAGAAYIDCLGARDPIYGNFYTPEQCTALVSLVLNLCKDDCTNNQHCSASN